MGLQVQLGAAPLEFGRQFIARGMALFLHMSEVMQVGVVVFPQSAGIEIDHMFELVQAILNLDHLVDLFLIFGDHEARAAMVQHIGHLFGGRVLIERHGNRAHGLRRDHRPIQLWPVAADDGDEITLIDTKVDQAAGQIVHFALNILPRPCLPDAEFLFTVSGLVREPLGVALQQRRYGRVSTGRL